MAEYILGNIAVIPMGSHNSSVSYDKNSLVESNGSMYLAKRAVPSGTIISNTTYWMLSAAKGTNGTNGTSGTDGSDGISVSNATINGNGHLILILSDTSTIDCGVAKGTNGTNGAAFTYADFTTEQLAALKGADGQDGTNGTDGATITSVAFVGNDMVFTNSDSTTATITNGKTSLTGSSGTDGTDGIDGATITSAAFVGSDLVFTKSDSSTVTITGGKTTLTGATGDTGLSGADGTDGADGESAYTAAQTGGYSGTQSAFYADLAAIEGLAEELAAL